MSTLFSQGIIGVGDNAAQIRNDISVVAVNWFANRCPLVTRSRRLPVGSLDFTIVSRNYRPRSFVLNAAVANNTVTTITLTDVSSLMSGDVLQLLSGERVQVVGDPNTSANTITVTRNVEGTTAASQNNSTTALLIGSARSGSEVNQSGIGLKPVGIAQHCQTWQHPVQVGGSLQATSSFVTPPGVSTPFEEYKMDALQNMMDDMEVSSYQGYGESFSTNGKSKQLGLVTQIARSNVIDPFSVGAKATSPISGGAYKPTDLIRDTLQVARANGGAPDIMLVASDFMTAFATWGQAVQRIPAGETTFGVAIDMFEAPFLNGIAIIEAPLLTSGTAVALTSSEIVMRMKRNEFWNPHGVRGDAIEGDWIAEGAIEVNNPGHHAWVSGISGYSAT